MAAKVTLTKDFVKGMWEQNPIFRQVLGMCPVLAVTVSAENAIAMALATTFVLVFSSFIVSLVKNWIPAQVRIAAYILIIATFVTIVDLVMKAKFPELSKALGPFIPLIIVNCLILGRQEAFASKNSVGRSVLDALGMGTGFLIALTLLGSTRELFGSGTILGIQLMPDIYEPWLIMILPAGAFLTLGLMMGFFRSYSEKKKKDEHNTLIKKYLEAKESVETNPVEVS